MRTRLMLGAVVLAAAGVAVPVSHASGCANVTTIGKDWTLIKAPSFTANTLPEQRTGAGSVTVTMSPVSPTRLIAEDSYSVFTSIDGGCSWKTGPSLNSPSASVPHDGYTSELTQAFWAPAPSTPNTAYAVFGSPDNALFADDPTISVLKTTDGGATWAALNLGPAAVGYAPSLAVAPSDPNHLYLSLQHGVVLAAPQLVFASTDGGATWTMKSVLPDNIQRQDTMAMTVDPLTPTTLWASDYGTSNLATKTTTYVKRSRDGGATWTNLTLPPDCSGLQGMYAIHQPRSRTRLVAMGSENQGHPRVVCLSADEGDSWTTLAVPPHSGPVAVGRDQTRLVVGSHTVDSVAYRYVSRKKLWFGLSAPQPTDGSIVDVAFGGVYDYGMYLGIYFTYKHGADRGLAILRVRN